MNNENYQEHLEEWKCDDRLLGVCEICGEEVELSDDHTDGDTVICSDCWEEERNESLAHTEADGEYRNI